ncbi:GNAT family N-acetyltransferase [Lysobacter korlensis]|uniref:GNAT family N-acetyltransferase n=1 Tax=Lysobacter korlensis TaxID=553636 RepID=A0ABV6RP04_9GAMM
MSQVRKATIEDLGALAETLVLAFDGYPWTDFAMAEDRRAERLRRSFSHHLALAITHQGEVWMAEDAASVAAWIRPGPPPVPDELLRASERVAAETIGPRMHALSTVEERLAPLRPREPHWLLATMGTRPAARGRGLASSLLEPVLTQADASGTAAALETSTAANVAFYRRFGFEVSGVLDAAGGVPPVWVMVRPPR